MSPVLKPTSLLTCDASAWGQMSEKGALGWWGTGIRVCVPGSRATASCSQPLHRRGHSSPGSPGAAQLLPTAGGRAPRHGLGHVGEHPGPSVQKLRERGCPTWGSGTRAVTKTTTRSQLPSSSHLRAPGAADTASQGLRISPPAGGLQAGPPLPAPLRLGPRAAHLTAALGARAPAPLLCSSSGQSSPRGPARPLGPLTPGAVALTFPARPGPARPGPLLPHGRTLRGAFPAPQPLSAPAAPPPVRAPSPPRPASRASAPPRPSPSPGLSARARGRCAGRERLRRELCVSIRPARIERRAIDLWLLGDQGCYTCRV